MPSRLDGEVYKQPHVSVILLKWGKPSVLPAPRCFRLAAVVVQKESLLAPPPISSQVSMSLNVGRKKEEGRNRDKDRESKRGRGGAERRERRGEREEEREREGKKVRDGKEGEERERNQEVGNRCLAVLLGK